MHQALRFTLVLLAVALIVVPGLKTIAKAHAFNEVPNCAVGPLMDAIEASACRVTDLHCMCPSNSIFPIVQKAIQDKCSAEDQRAMQAVAMKHCGSHGTVKVASPGSPVLPRTTTMQLPTTSLIGPTVTSARVWDTAATKTSPSHTTYHKTMTYSRPMLTPSPTAAETGGGTRRLGEGLAAAALAMVVGPLGRVFSEL